MRMAALAVLAVSLAGCSRPSSIQIELDQLEQCARATALEAEALERSEKTPGYFQQGPINMPLTQANARAQIVATNLRARACARFPEFANVTGP